jgi:hypothetical protein
MAQFGGEPDELVKGLSGHVDAARRIIREARQQTTWQAYARQLGLANHNNLVSWCTGKKDRPPLHVLRVAASVLPITPSEQKTLLGLADELEGRRSTGALGSHEYSIQPFFAGAELERDAVELDAAGHWEAARALFLAAEREYGRGSANGARAKLGALRVEMKFGNYDAVEKGLNQLTRTYVQLDPETTLAVAVERSVLDFHRDKLDEARLRLDAAIKTAKDHGATNLGDAYQLLARVFMRMVTSLGKTHDASLYKQRAMERLGSAKRYHERYDRPSGLGYDHLRDAEFKRRIGEPADAEASAAEAILQPRARFHVALYRAQDRTASTERRLDQAMSAADATFRLGYALGTSRALHAVAGAKLAGNSTLTARELRAILDWEAGAILAYPRPETVRYRDRLASLTTLFMNLDPTDREGWLRNLPDRVADPAPDGPFRFRTEDYGGEELVAELRSRVSRRSPENDPS